MCFCKVIKKRFGCALQQNFEAQYAWKLEKKPYICSGLTEKWEGFGESLFSYFKFKEMSFKDKVSQLVADFLETRNDLYLVDLKISAANDITVIMDGDEGLSLQDCLDASRAIEFNLDREEQDFSLQVMSPGLSEPLAFPRQYKKNIGRELQVMLLNGEEVQGEIMAADDVQVILTLRYRRPKLVGKGKEDVVEERAIPYTEIKKALIVIKF